MYYHRDITIILIGSSLARAGSILNLPGIGSARHEGREPFGSFSQKTPLQSPHFENLSMQIQCNPSRSTYN